MMRQKTRHSGLAASLLAIGLATSASSASAVVDCNEPGQSIAAEIAAGKTEIEFVGSCNEYLVIQTDGISISGASGDRTRDVIAYGLDLRGAQRVSLRSFTIVFGSGLFNGSAAVYDDVVMGGLSVNSNSKAEVTESLIRGPYGVSVLESSVLYMQLSPIEDLAPGIVVADGAWAYITSSDITNTRYGIEVARNASLTLLGGSLGPATEDNGARGCNPLCIRDGSTALIDGTAIEGTNEDPKIGGAVTVSRNSDLRLIGNTSISNSGSQPAVGIYEASSLRQDRTNGLGGSLTGDLKVSGKSYADLRAGSVSGNIDVRLDSLLRLGASGLGSDPAQIVVTGSTTLAQDSHLVVEDPLVTINGDITCADRRSRLAGSFGGTGAVIKCRDFNNAKVTR